VYLTFFWLFIIGENRTAEFGEDELRCSLEWVGNKMESFEGKKRCHKQADLHCRLWK
jgi:hypothetical protein